MASRKQRAENPDMAQVRVVTDSTADIPPALASELEIVVVPARVFLEQKEYEDGVDLRPEEFFDRLRSSEALPRTSQPPPGQFAAMYHQILDETPDASIVSIHVAGNLSGTVNSAWTGAQVLPDPSRVEVIDSGQLSMALGWAVIEAARLAQGGASMADVSQHVQRVLPRLRTAAMIDTLENLVKGGRISQVSATLGTMLQIKPLVSIQFGKIAVWGKVRTRTRALKRLAAEVHSWDTLAEMAVLHTGAEELAENLASMLEDIAPAGRTLLEPAGSALTFHLGLGAVGVCALAEGNKSE